MQISSDKKIGLGHAHLALNADQIRSLRNRCNGFERRVAGKRFLVHADGLFDTFSEPRNLKSAKDALAFESFDVKWTRDVIIAMLWSVFILSGIGISLMFYLLRSGSVTKVTSTMYVVPGLTALFAWILFDERLT
jgi:hypothetical protein